MNKEIALQLVEDTVKDIVTNNSGIFKNLEMPTEQLELSVKLSAITTLKILEKLELIE